MCMRAAVMGREGRGGCTNLSLLAGICKLVEGSLGARPQAGSREGHQERLPQRVRQPQVAVPGAQQRGGAPRAHALPRQRRVVAVALRHGASQARQRDYLRRHPASRTRALASLHCRRRMGVGWAALPHLPHLLQTMRCVHRSAELMKGAGRFTAVG